MAMDIEGRVNSTIGSWGAEVHVGQCFTNEFVESRRAVKAIKQSRPYLPPTP